MGLSCILTDDAAQFTRPTFPGSKYLRYLTSQLELVNGKSVDIHQVKISDMPRRISLSGTPSLIPPSFEYITNEILSLYQAYDDIFIILSSQGLYPLFSTVDQIVSKLHGRATIHLIDSQSVSIGEGLIVQKAAELATAQMPGDAVEENLREMIPHIYTLLCTPNLSYLHNAGFIDFSQAIVGEMLSLLPIFALEEGLLNPMEKVKNYRSVIDYFIEFIDEFDDMKGVSFLHPAAPGLPEAKLIRQHMEENFPDVGYSEHTINPFLASLIGPRGMGIVIMENED